MKVSNVLLQLAKKSTSKLSRRDDDEDSDDSDDKKVLALSLLNNDKCLRVCAIPFIYFLSRSEDG